MTQHGTTATPVEVESYLKGTDFPASRHELIEFARFHHAPEHVLKVLEGLPDRDYTNAADVARDMGKD